MQHLRRFFALAAAAASMIFCTAAAADPGSQFRTLAAAYLAQAESDDPLFADSIGVHAYDDALPDLSAAGHARSMQHLLAWRQAFGAVDAARLNLDDRADLAAMRDEIAARIFEDDNLRPYVNDPTMYVGAIGDASFQIISREYAPLDERLRHVAARMLLVPRIVAAAEAQLGRPPKVVTELAIQQNAGNIDTYKTDLIALAKKASPGTRALIAQRAPAVVASLTQFQEFMRGPLLARSDGPSRVGARVFDTELRLVVGTDVSRPALVARAQRRFAQTRRRMFALAKPLYASYFPGRPVGDDDRAVTSVVRAVLDRLAADHPRRDAVLATAKADVAKLEAFLRVRPVVPLPVPDTLHVVSTPAFKAGFAGAALDAAGPFTPLAGSFYDIDPIPASWPSDRVDSYLRDFNNYELQILSDHEAVPGHYVQFRYNAAVPSLVRRAFANGSFVEGWAVYTEGMMLDAGFGGNDPRLRLFQLKWRLREYANAIIDAQYHAGSLTHAQCLELLENGAFQERAQAEGKWHRLQLSHDQLSTYFAGLDAIETAARDERATLGPRFDLAAFNLRLLHMGSVEPRFIERLMNQ